MLQLKNRALSSIQARAMLFFSMAHPMNEKVKVQEYRQSSFQVAAAKGEVIFSPSICHSSAHPLSTNSVDRNEQRQQHHLFCWCFRGWKPIELSR